MADPKPPIPVLAADYGELAQRIGRAALRAERIGAYSTASALIEAIPTLIATLGERAGREIDAMQMELARALAEVSGGE